MLLCICEGHRPRCGLLDLAPELPDARETPLGGQEGQEVQGWVRMSFQVQFLHIAMGKLLASQGSS